MEKYILMKKLGEGSYGVVWQAKDIETREIVAIKTLKRKYSSKEDCVGLRELQCHHYLQHENIISLKEVILEKPPICSLHLVFEYMECSLYDLIYPRLNLGSPFSERRIRKFAFQILKGLAHIHEQGYIHRDIKPENLLVSKGTIKIADFGLSREVGSTPCTAGVGTKSYSAPEVIMGCRNYTTAVDIWALGAVIAEMYSQSQVFSGKNDVVIIHKICSVIGSPTEISWSHGMLQAKKMKYEFPEMKGSKIPGASQSGESLIRRMCSWDPLQRPTASEALLHPFFTGHDNSFKLSLQTFTKLDNLMKKWRKSVQRKLRPFFY